MIINIDRDPIYSLYYLGGITISILSSNFPLSLEKLFMELKKEIKEEIHIDFFYYTLDWLFLMSIIYVDNGRIVLCESKD